MILSLVRSQRDDFLSSRVSSSGQPIQTLIRLVTGEIHLIEIRLC